MTSHVYNELVRVERAALARGPRTRSGGMAGVFDDMGMPILPDWVQRCMEAGGLALVTGGATRWKTGSWKKAAMVGGGVAAVYGVGVLAYTSYYRGRAQDDAEARHAAERPAVMVNGTLSCPNGGILVTITGDRWGYRTVCE